MKSGDREAFGDLLAGVMAFYRQDVSPFAFGVWWQAGKGFELDVVSKALTAHAMDPDRGQFAPKPADLVRWLQGTQGDRGLIAWGKVYEAAQRVGAYESVAFDDPAIHAAVADIGGWVTLCRTETDELPHLQRRFCASHQAYAQKRDGVAYPAVLLGAHDAENGPKGYARRNPVLVGNKGRARAVMLEGSAGAKTSITSEAQPVVKRIGAAV